MNLHSKNENKTVEKFNEFYTLIVHKLETKMNVLRANNALEYVAEKFSEFCWKRDIERHKNLSCTPQQNGLAQRMNKTNLERVRDWFLESGLLNSFRGEVVPTIAYLINRCPYTRTNFMSPMEVWSGGPIDYSNLNFF